MAGLDEGGGSLHAVDREAVRQVLDPDAALGPCPGRQDRLGLELSEEGRCVLEELAQGVARVQPGEEYVECMQVCERQVLQLARESLPPIEPDLTGEHGPQKEGHPDVRGECEPDASARITCPGVQPHVEDGFVFAFEQVLRTCEEAFRILQAQGRGVDSGCGGRETGGGAVWIRALRTRVVSSCSNGSLVCEQVRKPVLRAAPGQRQRERGSGDVDEFVGAEPVNHRGMGRQVLRESGRRGFSRRLCR